MKRHAALTITTLIAFASTSALASVSNVKRLEDGSSVTISGTVADVKNAQEFTLRDASGTITVDIGAAKSVVLEKGENVTVTGALKKGFLGLGTEINASNVKVNKPLAEKVSDAVEGNTPISFEGASAYKINSLPKDGLIKLSGTVGDVSNEKHFTLKDDTGSINVTIESPESAVVSAGANVTVIGYLDNGNQSLINAKKVIVN